jgi:hypothetical protein
MLFAQAADNRQHSVDCAQTSTCSAYDNGKAVTAHALSAICYGTRSPPGQQHCCRMCDESRAYGCCRICSFKHRYKLL